MRFTLLPLVLALSAVVGAQQPTAPQSTAPPPITFPFPPLMPPVVGGLTTPVPFAPTDPTRPARDLYRVSPGDPFNSRGLKPVAPYGGAFFGPIYQTPEPVGTP